MNPKSAHELEEGLIGADEAFPGAAEVREVMQQRKVVVLRAPLWVLLDAIDALDPRDLQQVARHVAHRLVSAKSR
jgi:hypothetical protein